MKEYGIDVSKWQGNFDFKKAASEGVKYAIVKGGGGDCGLYVDPKFSQNYTNAKAAGLPVGTYWFSKALTVEDALREADYFYNNCLKGKKFDLPVYMDVEVEAQLNLGQRLLTDIVKAWCERIKAKGYCVGIYSSLAFFNNLMYDNELQDYTHWVACWGNSCNYKYKNTYGMWQYGLGRVAGVDCDVDYMLMDLKALVKNGGKIPTAKPTAPAPQQNTPTYTNCKNIYVSEGIAALRTAASTSGTLRGRCARKDYYVACQTVKPVSGNQIWFKHANSGLYSALTDTNGAKLFSLYGTYKEGKTNAPVNIRATAGLNGTIVGKLSAGATVYMTGKTARGNGLTWCQIVYGGKLCWCDKQWVNG